MRPLVFQFVVILESVLAKLSRYDEGTLFSSFLSFTVSNKLLKCAGWKPESVSVFSRLPTSLCCRLQVKAASKYVDVPVSDNNPFFSFFFWNRFAQLLRRWYDQQLINRT